MQNTNPMRAIKNAIATQIPSSQHRITISGVTVDDNGNVVINGNLNVGDIIVGGSDIGL
jgi:hypothetical protein